MSDINSAAAQGPMTGLRVIDSSSYLTGPYTAVMLADLGAQVIKVEPPGGDAFRAFGHKRQGWSALWTSTNRGKRSIALDLKAEGDLAIMKQLLADADVLVENWRPQVAAKLGLGNDVVQALNPRLVRLSITGFGPSGPLSAAPAYDSLIQARTGMMALGAEGSPPEQAPYWVVDKVVAMFGAQAVLAALLQRERTGRGSAVSLPMLDVMSYFNFPDLLQHRTFVEDRTPYAPFFSPIVPTADGHIVISPASGAQMSRTLKAIERPDIKDEIKGIADPGLMVDTFYKRLGEVLVTRPSAHWLALFESFDLPVAAVRSLDEHLQDPQVLHNHVYHEVDTPAGTIRVARYPASFDGVQLAPAGTPPRVDEHGSEIRAEAATR
jgi:crotonobetainyl-CoA:carnitine CoA-transferase CaiB-like acyl-CoA transferase